jgi:hypothetical protein
MAVTGSLSVKVEYKDDVTTGGSRSTNSYNKDYKPNGGWTIGTGAGQFTKANDATGTLSASTNTHVLSAFVGNAGTTAFAAMKEVWVVNTGATAMKLTPGASQPWIAGFASDVNIPPGGAFLLTAPTAAGIPVGAGTADKFTVVSTGATTYEVELKGI